MIPRSTLDSLLEAADGNYRYWRDKKSGRDIQEPKRQLRQIHVRIAALLSRMETPTFLHSAVKGRSYVTNAAAHSADDRCLKVDIRRYYTSVRSQAVFHFFQDRMECRGDVAGMLTKLLTVNGHLATGSSASPILSYFAYEDMFHQVNEAAKAARCVMTCYVDDMVFTGPGATRKLLREIVRLLKAYRLWGHKVQRFNPGQTRIVTGIAITPVGARLPNNRAKAIHADKTSLGASSDVQAKVEIGRRLVGRMHEAAYFDERWSRPAAIMSERQKGLEREARKTKR